MFAVHVLRMSGILHVTMQRDEWCFHCVLDRSEAMPKLLILLTITESCSLRHKLKVMETSWGQVYMHSVCMCTCNRWGLPFESSGLSVWMLHLLVWVLKAGVVQDEPGWIYQWCFPSYNLL